MAAMCYKIHGSSEKQSDLPKVILSIIGRAEIRTHVSWFQKAFSISSLNFPFIV